MFRIKTTGFDQSYSVWWNGVYFSSAEKDAFKFKTEPEAELKWRELRKIYPAKRIRIEVIK